MDLRQKENRANAWRINYADFPEVFSGPIVSGTIIKVKSIYNAPSMQTGTNEGLFALPQVSVQIQGNEYDDVPLLYRPKKQYWDIAAVDSFDGQPHQAQDLDQDNRYYLTAWMSFRKGDEVLVACPADEDGNLTPFAVLGFVDRVLRPGEYIYKWWVTGTEGYLKATSSYPDTYEAGPVGPDGLQLLLKNPCKISGIDGSGEIVGSEYVTFVNCFMIGVNLPAGMGGPGCGTNPDWPQVQFEETLTIWEYSKTSLQWWNFVALVPIGPYLYRFSFSVLMSTVNAYMMIHYEYRPGPPPWWTPPWYENQEFQGAATPDGASQVGWNNIPNLPKEFTQTQALIDQGRIPANTLANLSFPITMPPDYQPPATDYPPYYPLSNPGYPFYGYSAAPGCVGPDYSTPTDVVDAAMFDPDLLQNPLSDQFQIVPVYPDDFFNALINLTGEQCEALIGGPDDMIKLFTRPHSKEELQTAKMWPFP
jgi:hypothetical protein